jgi:hypothetical protein
MQPEPSCISPCNRLFASRIIVVDRELRTVKQKLIRDTNKPLRKQNSSVTRSIDMALDLTYEEEIRKRAVMVVRVGVEVS